MLHALGRAECPVPGGWRAHVMAGRAAGRARGEASTGILSAVGERPPHAVPEVGGGLQEARLCQSHTGGGREASEPLSKGRGRRTGART